MTDLVEGLRTFVRVVESGSFSAVAREANANQTTIARRIDAIEQHFGVRLFQRSTRRLVLSDEGTRMLEHARLILDDLEQAEASLGNRRGSPSGTVRVGVTTALGFFLAERLAPLLSRYPDLRVELFVGDGLRGLAEDGLDLALRVGHVEDIGVNARPLGQIRRILVAAPAYLARNGVPATAAELMDHQCITYGYGPAPIRWNIDGRAIAVRGQFKANSSEAVQRATVAGLGISLLPWFQVAGQIRAGNLVALMAESQIEPLFLSVVYRARKGLPERSRVVLEHIADCYNETASPQMTTVGEAFPAMTKG
jgi:DNA-binding transcriptional LysR family regulator